MLIGGGAEWCRDESMSAQAFGEGWCEEGDILVPRWYDFLQDKCALPGEVAVPADFDTALTCGERDVRIAILQARGGVGVG